MADNMTDKLLSSIVFKSAIKGAFTLEMRPETLLHVRSMKINVMYRVDSILATKNPQQNKANTGIVQ